MVRPNLHQTIMSIDEQYLKSLRDKAKKSWLGLIKPDDWLNEIRGGSEAWGSFTWYKLFTAFPKRQRFLIQKRKWLFSLLHGEGNSNDDFYYQHCGILCWWRYS